MSEHDLGNSHYQANLSNPPPRTTPGPLRDNKPRKATTEQAPTADLLNKKPKGEAVKGIDKRLNADGTCSYRVRVRLAGHKPVIKSFRTLTHAKKWKRQTEVAIEEGRYFDNQPNKSFTLSNAIDRYFDVLGRKKPKDIVNMTRHLEWWRGKLGHRLLAEIKPTTIAECRDELLDSPKADGKPRSPSTVVRYLSTLSALMTTACNDWEAIRENPVSKIKKPTQPKGRTRYLTEDEMVRLLEACKNSKAPDLLAIFSLAVSTGMRRSELIWLRYSMLNLKENYIILEDTKNDEPRLIPLEGLPLQLLEERAQNAHEPNDLVFPSPKDPSRPIDFRTAFEHALEVADVKNFTFHSCRHSCASMLAMSGHSLLDIAKLLGHKDLQVTKRYAHLSHDYTRDMVKGLNDKIFKTKEVSNGFE